MARFRTWGRVLLSTVTLLIVATLFGSAFYLYPWKNIGEDLARWTKQDRLSSESSRPSHQTKTDVAADPQASRADIETQLAWAYIKRGIAFQARGEDDRAIADFTKALEINPQLTQAYTKRGVAYEAIGLREEAITDYRRALAIDGNEFSKSALKRLGALQ